MKFHVLIKQTWKAETEKVSMIFKILRVFITIQMRQLHDLFCIPFVTFDIVWIRFFFLGLVVVVVYSYHLPAW